MDNVTPSSAPEPEGSTSPHPNPSQEHQAPLDQRVPGMFEDAGAAPIALRLLLYGGMVGALYLVLEVALSYLHLYVQSFLWLAMIQEGGRVLVAVLPAVVMARIEGRPFCRYGLPPRNIFGRLFWIGGLWGLVSLSVLLGAMHVAGVFNFGTLVLHGARIAKFGIFWAVFFLLVGFYEEFLTRGYTQFTLTQGIGFWPAAILLSLAFGSLHLFNERESRVGILCAAFIGFFFCLTLRRTGNLWFAVGFHAAWDWGETYLYSVPDSGCVAPGHLLHSSSQGAPWLTGGSVGPEGSLLAFVLIALVWVVFDRVYPEVKYRTD